MADNMDVRIENEGVFYAQGSVVKIGVEEIEFLKEKFANNPGENLRLCMHKDIADPVHEMLILHSKKTYVRPHKYDNKSVSYHIIEGVVDFVLFDEEGGIQDVILMGEYGTGRNFYQRLNGSFYYMPLIHSELLLFHETTNGPFKISDAIYPSWAAAGNDPDAISLFQKELILKVDAFIRSRTSNITV